MSSEQEAVPCIKGVVKCGDWIYPSSQSTSGVRYSIDYPVVVNLFLQKKDGDRKLSTRGAIHCHLDGPRYLKVKITKDTLTIKSLRNEQEEKFKKKIDWSCKFDIAELDRLSDLGLFNAEEFENRFDLISESSERLAVLFAGILLQVHKEKGKKAKFPKGISFREATIPEIESLGRW